MPAPFEVARAGDERGMRRHAPIVGQPKPRSGAPSSGRIRPMALSPHAAGIARSITRANSDTP